MHINQLDIYDQIMSAVLNSARGVLFVSDHGGTGKTYFVELYHCSSASR
jgi:hypothetical protein